VLDTGGQATAVKADGAFIGAAGWVRVSMLTVIDGTGTDQVVRLRPACPRPAASQVACEGGTEACNRNCPTGQGPGARFFNTSFRIEVASNESAAEAFTIVCPLAPWTHSCFNNTI
jgi:hypothetical protein